MPNSLLSPHVASIVDTFIPEHIRISYPKLVQFIEAYLEYLETTHGSGYYQNTLQYQRDLDLQEQQFLARIERELGIFVPREYAADPKIFYRKISELWRAKGSEEAIKTFFLIFLNDLVVVRYPWDKVLKPSDGQWSSEVKLRVTIISGDAYDFIGKKIQQIESFATGFVERVRKQYYEDATIYELTLVNGETVGQFLPGNRITVSGETIEAEIYRSVSQVNVISGGTNYEQGDRILIDNYDGVTFIGFVSEIDPDTGAILSVEISNFGAGNTPEHLKTGDYYIKDFFVYSTANDQLVSGVTPTIVVRSDNGTGAEFSLSFNSLVQTSGRYIGVRGQLSESIVLQDSRFYQKFSYEVVSDDPINRWLSTLKQTVHPAGVAVFANVRLSDELNLKTTAFTHTDLFIPPIYTMGENLELTENISAWIQNYTANDQLTFAEPYVGQELINEQEISTAITPVPNETFGA